MGGPHISTRKCQYVVASLCLSPLDLLFHKADLKMNIYGRLININCTTLFPSIRLDWIAPLNLPPLIKNQAVKKYISGNFVQMRVLIAPFCKPPM